MATVNVTRLGHAKNNLLDIYEVSVVRNVELR